MVKGNNKKKNLNTFRKAKQFGKKFGVDIETLSIEGMELKKDSYGAYKCGGSTNSGFRVLAWLYEYTKDNG